MTEGQTFTDAAGQTFEASLVDIMETNNICAGCAFQDDEQGCNDAPPCYNMETQDCFIFIRQKGGQR